MGASNFSRPNASAIFAVLMDTEEKVFKCNDCSHSQYEYGADYLEPNSVSCCPECESENIEWTEEYRSCEDFEIDDFFYYLKEKVEEIKGFRVVWNGAKDYENIFYLQTDKNFGDVNIDVRVYGTMEVGYHEGANLDWRVECNDNEDEIGDLSDDFYNSDMSVGLQVIQAKNAQKWADKTSKQMIEAIEKIYYEISNPL